MSKQRLFTFLYDNILASASVSSDSTAVNYSPEFLNRQENWLIWLPATGGLHYITWDCGEDRTADAFGFAEHQLFTSSGTIALEHSANGTDWTAAFAAFTPYSDHPGYVEFSEVTARYWRAAMDSTPASPLGVVMLGQKEVMEQGHFVGFSPPGLNVDVETLTNTSRDGYLLGTAIKDHGATLELELDNLTDQWTRSEWAAIRRHASTGAYFIQWDNENRPYETAYCWASTNPAAVTYQDGRYSTTSLQSRCMTAHHYEPPEPPPNPPPEGVGIWIYDESEYGTLRYKYAQIPAGNRGQSYQGFRFTGTAQMPGKPSQLYQDFRFIKAAQIPKD